MDPSSDPPAVSVKSGSAAVAIVFVFIFLVVAVVFAVLYFHNKGDTRTATPPALAPGQPFWLMVQAKKTKSALTYIGDGNFALPAVAPLVSGNYKTQPPINHPISTFVLSPTTPTETTPNGSTGAPKRFAAKFLPNDMFGGGPTAFLDVRGWKNVAGLTFASSDPFPGASQTQANYTFSDGTAVAGTLDLMNVDGSPSVFCGSDGCRACKSGQKGCTPTFKLVIVDGKGVAHYVDPASGKPATNTKPTTLGATFTPMAVPGFYVVQTPTS